MAIQQNRVFIAFESSDEPHALTAISPQPKRPSGLTAPRSRSFFCYCSRCSPRPQRPIHSFSNMPAN